MLADIHFEQAGDMAWAVLDRPKALNALDLAMVDGLADWLAAASRDNNISALGMRAAGGTAFSAGGDVRALYGAGERGEMGALHHFSRQEYRLNRAIHHCAKPYLAVIDGLVMGGGAGVSINGRYRLVGPNARFAMPETGIGFFPDVGASWFLSRCPGQIGPYIGLTGVRLGPADMLYAGIATHYRTSTEQAVGLDAIANLLHDAGRAELANFRPAIDRCFSGDSVEEILSTLDQEGDEWARITADGLRQRSPTALKVGFRQLRQAAALDFDAAMSGEYRLARHFMRAHAFFEAVRTAVIDKDRN